MIIYCFINAGPHFIFGAGEEALSLTKEFGAGNDAKQLLSIEDIKDKKMLCRTNCKTNFKFRRMEFIQILI